MAALYVAVVGAGDAKPELDAARRAGRAAPRRGRRDRRVRRARRRDGRRLSRRAGRPAATTVGLLPGADRARGQRVGAGRDPDRAGRAAQRAHRAQRRRRRRGRRRVRDAVRGRAGAEDRRPGRRSALGHVGDRRDPGASDTRARALALAVERARGSRVRTAESRASRRPGTVRDAALQIGRCRLDCRMCRLQARLPDPRRRPRPDRRAPQPAARARRGGERRAGDRGVRGRCTRRPRRSRRAERDDVRARPAVHRRRRRRAAGRRRTSSRSRRPWRRSPPDTTVAFFAREEGRTKAPTRLHEAVRQAGGDISAEESVKPWELPKWVIARGPRARADSSSHDAARALVQQVGDRQQRLLRELEKLALGSGPDAQIDAAEIEELTAASAERKAWSLADALVAGERARPPFALPRAARARASACPAFCTGWRSGCGRRTRSPARSRRASRWPRSSAGCGCPRARPTG